MNLTEEAKEKIKQCPHDSFNGGTLQCCDGCGHPRLYIQGFEDALRSQWVRIEDGLPEHGTSCLVSTHNQVIVMAVYVNGKFQTLWDDLKTVAAWMPLPAPYQEEVE